MNEQQEFFEESADGFYPAAPAEGFYPAAPPSPGTALAATNPAMQFSLGTFEPDMRVRSARQLARRAGSEEQGINHRANLTKVAMGNTAGLSQMADQIGAAVPSAERNCRSLVDMYAITTGIRIARWS